MKIRNSPLIVTVAALSLAGCSMMEQQFGMTMPSQSIAIGADVLKAATLSDEDTVSMARQVAAEMDRSNQIADSKSVYAKRLAGLVSGHQKEDGLNLNFKVYIDPEVNAFSLADGTIRVYSGLMDRMNDEQLMFVVGHEIGHIKSGHSKSRMQRAHAAAAATGLAGSFIESKTGNSVGGVAAAIGSEMLAELAADVIKSQFSQSDELESDDYGVYFLARNGKRPEAALEALQVIEGDSASDDKGMLAQFTSTHPAGPERIENVGTIIASLGGGIPQEGRTQLAKVEKTSTQETQGWSKGTQVERPVPVQRKTVALKAPATQAPKLPAADKKTSGWYIQLAAFPDPAPAESMVGALRERSERVTLQSTVVKGSQYERVLVGPYPTRQNAAVELDRVVSHGIFEGEPFVRRLPD